MNSYALPIITTVLIGFTLPGLAQSTGANRSDPSSVHSAEAIKHYNRAVELHCQGYFKQAKPEYLASLEDDAHFEQAWCNLGCIYSAERNYEKAIEAFERAIAIKPNRTTTLNGYASALYGVGRIDDAIKQWYKTIDLDPTFQFASYNLANALERSGRHDEAQETLRKAGLIGTKGQILEPKIPANRS